VSDQKGKSISRELKDNDANVLLGLQIGQETDASILGLQGKIKITGGSDKSGVAMRGDVAGVPRKRILISKGVGLQDVKKGLRKRKLVRGNIISEEIYQINCKYDGKIDLEPKEEAPKEEAKKEAPKKEAPKKEAPKKEAPKKEAPKKEAPKKEAPKKETKKEAPKEAPKKETKKEAPKEAPKKE
jgi:small subunit ribosomal protein S6e